MTAMRLGVHLPVAAGKGAPPSIILEVAAEAERIGLDSVWSWERLMRPTVPIALGVERRLAGYGCTPGLWAVYDPIETLATSPPANQPITRRYRQRARCTLPKPNHSRAQARDARPAQRRSARRRGRPLWILLELIESSTSSMRTVG